MKIGMVFECGQKGADGKVYPYLAQQLRSDIEITTFFLDNKPGLIGKSGIAVKQLLEIDGCEKIILIWDLRPPWKKSKSEPLCAVEDCNRIIEVLKVSQLTPQQLHHVRLICVEQELETLLLFDTQAISSYLSEITGRNCRIKPISHPERNPNPKQVLYKMFQENHCREYRDSLDAEKMIRQSNIARLRRCPAFARFERRIMAL